MDTAQMTVAQITALLSQPDISLHIITKLKQDARLSVQRIVERWEARRQKEQKEKERISALYNYERGMQNQGYSLVAGIDEAGRGPLAGPVVIGAVILPPDCYLPGLNDSKKLSAAQREKLYQEITAVAVAVNRCIVGVEIIDYLNIYHATIAGMYKAIEGLVPAPQAVLIDAVPLPRLAVPSESIVSGDQLSASIAAASIIAKVERDQIMDELDCQFPMYGFKRHKGYGTQEHMNALQQYGPCKYHRRSFAPVNAVSTTNNNAG